MAFNWNPATTNAGATITDNTVSFGGDGPQSSHTDKLPSGTKLYWEILYTAGAADTDVALGVSNAASDTNFNQMAGLFFQPGLGWNIATRSVYIDGSRQFGFAPAVADGAIVQFALDPDLNKIWIGVDNSFVGNPETNLGGYSYNPATIPDPDIDAYATSAVSFTGRWTEADLTYAVPAGFSAIDLPADTIGQIDLPVAVDVFLPTGQPSFTVQIDVSESGTLAVPVTVGVQQTGQIALPVEVEVPEKREIARRFQISVQQTGQIALPVEVEVQNPNGALSVPVQITSTQTGQIGVGVSVSVFDSSQPHRCQWSARVLLDGVDVSTRLTEQISVSASEGAARVATFTLKPFAGVVDPNQWIGKRVVIDYLDADQVQRRLFSGFVDTPRYNATDRLTTFECSDLLQNSLESAQRDQIDRLVGGFWSDLVFDADADGWRYAQDRLSTIPASLDLDRFGAARVTSWQSKASPDFSFQSERVVNGSLGVSLVSRRELLNRVQLVAEYRYARNWQAEKRFSWYFDNTLCQQLRDEGKTTPNRPMIEAAIDSSGWLKKSIDYTPPPSSRDVRCPGSATVSFWSISDELRDFLVWGVRYVIARRWSQSLTESYAVTVEAPESIEAVGEISKEQRTGFQSEDSGDWDKWETYEESNGEPVATGVTYSNRDERQSADTALLALIGRTRSDILKSHRANSVTFQTLIQPEMERTHTAKIETETVTAQGKVSGITHVLDFATGSALTDVQLAVSRKLGEQTTQDSGTVAPDAPADEFADAGRYSTRLESQYGGRFTSGEQQEIEGYTGNYDPPNPGAPLFDVNWAFTAPAIDTDFTDSKTLESPSVNRIAIPDDILEMVA